MTAFRPLGPSVDFTAVAPLTHTHSFTSPDVLKYFEEQWLIPTNGAGDWESFTIGSDFYLAVANNFFSTVQNFCSVSKYDKKPLLSQFITLNRPIIVLLGWLPSDFWALIDLVAQETDVFHYA